MPLGDCTRWCEKAEPTRSGRLWAPSGMMRRKQGKKPASPWRKTYRARALPRRSAVRPPLRVTELNEISRNRLISRFEPSFDEDYLQQGPGGENGAHLDDAVMKAKGLAVYAQDHGHRFGRIELLDKIGGSLLRLDMKDKKVRDQVKAVANNDGLVTLYKAAGK